MAVAMAMAAVAKTVVDVCVWFCVGVGVGIHIGIHISFIVVVALIGSSSGQQRRRWVWAAAMVRAARASPDSVSFTTQRLELGVGGESPRRHTCTPGPGRAARPASHTSPTCARLTRHSVRLTLTRHTSQTAAARERGGEGRVGEGGVGQTDAWPGLQGLGHAPGTWRDERRQKPPLPQKEHPRKPQPQRASRGWHGWRRREGGERRRACSSVCWRAREQRRCPASTRVRGAPGSSQHASTRSAPSGQRVSKSSCRRVDADQRPLRRGSARWPTARFDRATSPAARRHSSVPPPPPCSRLERSTGPGSGSSRTSRERRRS